MEAFAFEFQKIGGAKEAFFPFHFFRIFAWRRDRRFGRKLTDGNGWNLISSFQ